MILLLLSFYGAAGQQLKVMTFNIWHGGRETGEEAGPLRVVDVIRDSGADIVAMQETYGSGERIAKELGYHLYLRSTNLSILSRYPIVDTLDAYEPFNSGAVTINVQGQPVVVACNWLNFPFDYWEMLEKRQVIDSAKWIHAFEGEKNTDILRGILHKLSSSISNSEDVPVIVCGDFNSGSHLDWIQETRHLNSGYVIPFPATLLMEKNGFVDAFRQIHPDPVRHRGITWTPVNPAAHQDRIDYIFYKGCSLRPIDAEVINTHSEVYPSDHGAVTVTFRMQTSPDDTRRP
ncbi:Endonuclease/Exonuclease/phosphatase family protein [compost metagenome]|uniref:endonuclease/exonuclease/phosphatase family protein n=1 Tax=Sphingobacterium sp. DR205 TaxID=2713573 RepID=UPI000F90F8AF|nr:endonuclease/exonuclease/phosphatase family protein [Sphingobacterium sp. DR205]QIH35611.1 endonuclease/exonuclease/phosphatase family protein [Sphingobacterium sp. DR205]